MWLAKGTLGKFLYSKGLMSLLLLSALPIYRWGIWGKEKPSKLPKVTQSVNCGM